MKDVFLPTEVSSASLEIFVQAISQTIADTDNPDWHTERIFDYLQQLAPLPLSENAPMGLYELHDAVCDAVRRYRNLAPC